MLRRRTARYTGKGARTDAGEKEERYEVQRTYVMYGTVSVDNKTCSDLVCLVHGTLATSSSFNVTNRETSTPLEHTYFMFVVCSFNSAVLCRVSCDRRSWFRPRVLVVGRA